MSPLDELSRTEILRLATLGRLTASITHDLNNLFTVVQLQAAVAAESPESGEATEAVARIAAASRRGSDLVRRILDTVRGKPEAREPVSVSGVVSNVCDLIKPLLGAQCSLSVETGNTALPDVLVNPCGMEQVLMNLILNAADAMPAGGTIRLVVRHCLPESESSGREAVELVVTDEGRGIEPGALPSLFKPFFTTRGSGTGLGLSIVKEWVEMHGGTISVRSAPGEGSSFHVVLPVHANNPLREATDACEATDAGSPGLSILLVEDDDGIRRLAAAFLEKSGWRVLEADSAEAALRLWKARGSEIGLLFTDLVLGGIMDGRQLALAVQQDSPGFPVIYTSGYYSADGSEVWLSDANFLPKPFHPRKLSEMVRRSLRTETPHPVPAGALSA